MGLKHFIIILLFLLLPAKVYTAPILSSIDTITAGQEIQITGKVTNADDGSALAGASIQIKGSSTGTTTNIDGHYTIKVPDTSILVFSYVGFLAKEISINGREVIDIQLTSLIYSLDAITVLGYGTNKKVNLTGSVSTVLFDNETNNRPLTNASQALAGKVPGAWLSQNSGKPGSDEAQIRIRGWGTLNNAEPLVVIDGVEGNIADVNPNDIERISVLKDAASAAIYGSKAANGVILITTREGYEGKPVVSYNAYFGVQSLGEKYDLVDNSVQFMQLWNEAAVNDGGTNLFPDDVISAFKSGQDRFVYPNVNFFDKVYRNANISEHNISIKSGDESSSYYFSFNHLNQDGIMRNTASKRYGIQLNLKSKLNKWLTVGGRINGNRSISDEPYDIWRVSYLMANGGYPFIAPYTREGKFGSAQAIYLSGINAGNMIVDNRNPLPDLFNGELKSTSNFMKINAFADVTLTPEITIKTQFSNQNKNVLTDQYNQLLYGFTNTGIRSLPLDFPTTIEAIRTTDDNFFYTWYTTFNYNKVFDEVHELSVIGGTQIENREIKNTFARKANPSKPGLTQVDAGTSGELAGGNLLKLRIMSWFGRAFYAFNDKYLVELNLRADGSSRFKEGNRWGVFPGVSAGWRISEEPFLGDLDIIQNLKLRASWGQLGNQNINNYWPYLTLISQSNNESYNLGGQFVPGAAITALVDEDISWETTETTDIGLDVGLLNNRLSFELDYFKKTTKDIIVALPISNVLGGVEAPFENIGEMENEGFEINVNYSDFNADKSGIGYSVSGNLTYVNNEVVKFKGGNAPDQLYLIREGASYKSLYGFKAEGIYKTDAEASSHLPNSSFTPRAGDIRYKDVNGDGDINFLDKQGLGNTIPEFTYAFNLEANYRGFDLKIILQGISGVSGYTQNAWTQPLGISGGTVTKRWTNAWSETNTDSDLPRIRINDPWNRKESSFWVSSLSHFKIKNIQLGYSVPESITNKMMVGNIYIYINAQNLHTFVSDDYEGFDPEKNTFDSGEFTYPTPKIFSMGLNVNF